MYDWYCRFYAAIATSRANAEFCERAYGRDLSQHGFADVAQVERLIAAADIGPDVRVLDLGCGNGRIAEYISDATGARVHGTDYIPEAIRQAIERTRAKRDRVTFAVADMATLDESLGRFDVVLAADTLYFTDLADTVRRLKDLLEPGGRIAASYSIALRDYPNEPTSILEAGNTPLARAFAANGLRYEAEDLTAADLAHARLRQAILPELAAAFAAEGNGFIYDNRLGEANGVTNAIAAGTHRRYLYVAGKSSS